MRQTLIMGAAATAMLAFTFAAATAVENASSPCKGHAEAACKAEASCSWVKPRKSKAGKDIVGFCRSKPGKKAKAAPAAAKS
jgi:hypothetical protein